MSQTLQRLIDIRQDLHRHPELGFEEHETARKVCDFLQELQVAHVSGIGQTGVVATLYGTDSESSATVALRADMDALPIDEQSGVPYSSGINGRMHACGHDGHTSILLGVVEQLHRNADFSGTVHCIFQPAEEGVGGASAMLDAGLFEQFPVAEIYALHNWPDLPVGKFGLIEGPVMAGGDRIDITIQGRGGHGGMNPHGCIDPIRMAADLITRAHTIIAREVDPLHPAVLSICAIEAGDIDRGFAVIPDTARLCGTIRALDNGTRDVVRDALRRLCQSLEQYYDTRIELSIDDRFDVTVNDADATRTARETIVELFGDDTLADDHQPCMGGEDFSYMLAACPGAYVHVGAGDDSHGYGLHHPKFDFNDAILPTGIDLLAGVARRSLAKQAAR